jgi:hypothetical protein
VVGLIAGLAASSHAGAAAPRATTVRFVAPVDPNGHPLASDRIIRTVRGACEVGSEFAGPPAYRCVAGNDLYEACWPADYDPRHATTLLCLLWPWSHDVVRIGTRGLRASHEPPTHSLRFPWAVQLTSGQRCVLSAGTRERFRGRVIDYYCGGKRELQLLRPIHQTDTLWSFESVRRVGVERVEEGSVVTVQDRLVRGLDARRSRPLRTRATRDNRRDRPSPIKGHSRTLAQAVALSRS